MRLLRLSNKNEFRSLNVKTLFTNLFTIDLEIWGITITFTETRSSTFNSSQVCLLSDSEIPLTCSVKGWSILKRQKFGWRKFFSCQLSITLVKGFRWMPNKKVKMKKYTFIMNSVLLERFRDYMCSTEIMFRNKVNQLIDF